MANLHPFATLNPEGGGNQRAEGLRHDSRHCSNAQLARQKLHPLNESQSEGLGITTIRHHRFFFGRFRIWHTKHIALIQIADTDQR